MSRLRVINGSTLLKDYVLDIYPYALQYYGDQYKSIIDSSLDHTIIYEWNDENPKDIMEDVMGTIIMNEQIGNLVPNQDNYRGFHFLFERTPKDIDHIVVVKNIGTEDEIKAVLTHELYGHAICGHKPAYITVNNEKVERNGISVMNNNIQLNDLANEGIIEYIATNIMSLYNPKYTRSNNMQAYAEGVNLATQLFKYIGKEKMIELMVYYKYDINDLFDSNDKTSWDKLSSDLEDDKDIDEYIDSFIKRYKYNR